MSQEEQRLSRAEKKAQRDAERHKKSKKRKHAETEEQDATEAVEPAKDLQSEVTEPTKKSKKRKSKDLEDGDGPAATNEPKKKRKKTKSEPTTTAAEGEQAADGESATTTKHEPKKSRFILFIGNLSFKTTTETLRAHFKSLEPFTLRHLTDPKTKKSKGCAFIEFDNYDKLKTCLKLYHHSIFDPTKKAGAEPVVEGDGKKLGKDARKINVELTAGGGGKTEGRKEKIKQKNTRLEEQRKRRAELERKEKAKKEVKEGGVKGKSKEKPVSVKDELEARAGAKEKENENESHGIHPSRLARLNN